MFIRNHHFKSTLIEKKIQEEFYRLRKQEEETLVRLFEKYQLSTLTHFILLKETINNEKLFAEILRLSEKEQIYLVSCLINFGLHTLSNNIINKLINKHPMFNATNQTKLENSFWFFWAVREEMTNLIKFIYQRFPDTSASFVETTYQKTLLHLAAELGNVELVRFFTILNINIDACDMNGNTPLISAMDKLLKDRSRTHNSVVRILVNAGANIPEKYSNLKYLKIKKPFSGEIEYYDEKKQQFSTNIDLANPKEQSKDVAVLFFSEYDHEIPSPYFGAITQYFDQSNVQYRNLYASIAKNFLLFRAIIYHSQQILIILGIIKNRLRGTQEIRHFMLHAHSSPIEMRLSAIEQGTLYSLQKSDAKNNFVISKACKIYLAEDSTIALFGCNTAPEEIDEIEENITKNLSSVTQANQIVFGSPNLCSKIHYETRAHKGKMTLFPYFDDNKKYLVTAYRNGDKIAHGEWEMRRSRL